MKALIVEAPGQLAFREIAEPRLGPYDALVQIEVCGICNSTDRKLIEGTLPWAPSPPFVLGHESVGRVLEVGALVRKFRIGDRVTRAQSHGAGEIPNLGVCIGGFAERGTVRDVEAMVAAGDTSLADNWAAARRCRVVTLGRRTTPLERAKFVGAPATGRMADLHTFGRNEQTQSFRRELHGHFDKLLYKRITPAIRSAPTNKIRMITL